MFKALSQDERIVFKMVAAHDGDFTKAAHELGMDNEKQLRPIYERARQIVVIAIHGEPNNTWPTFTRIATDLQISRTTLAPLIKDFESASIIFGRYRRYPPAVLKQIGQTFRQRDLLPPAGDGLTITELRSRTGLSPQYIKKLISLLGLPTELRRHPNRKVFLYCFPEAEETLRFFVIPKAGNRLSVKVIADILHTDSAVVRKALSELGIQGEVRRPNSGGRATMYYRRSVVARVRRHCELGPSPTPRLNKTQIADHFGRSSAWLRPRLEKLKPVAVQQRDARGCMTDHFEMSILEQIAALDSGEELQSSVGDGANRQTEDSRRLALC